MMTRAYIILLFSISSFLFPHGSAAGLPKGISPSNIEQWSKAFENTKKTIEFINSAVEAYNKINSSRSTPSPSKSTTDIIKNFQRRYGLPVTGKVTSDTIELIQRPRCGVPDDVNTDSTMLQNGVISFDWPWPKGKKHFTYAFPPEDKVPSSLKATFSRAFSRWENVTGLSLDETAAFDESDIRIVFSRLNASKVVAASSDLLNSTIMSWRGMYFDVNENWVLPGGNMKDDELDIETAVMHQIGHVLGFGHTTKDHTAVMFPFLEPGKRKLNFSEGESDKIQQAIRTDSPSDTISGGGGGNTTSGGGGVRPGCVWLGIALLSLAQFPNARILI